MVFIPSKSPTRDGRENIIPKKLDNPDNNVMMLRETILPIAISDLFTGVTSSVAMVPLSFSPAIESGAMATQPLNNRIIKSIGISMDTNLPVISDSVARSNLSSDTFMSNRLLICCSSSSKMDSIME